MSKGTNEVTPENFSGIGGNPIEQIEALLATLLSSGKITIFSLNSCMLPVLGTVSTTSKYIFNELNNSSLKQLSLNNSHINITHVHYLILLVKMKSNLLSLDLSEMILTRPFLFFALHYSILK